MIKSKLKILLATHDTNQSKLAKEINVRQPTISAIVNNTIKQIPIDVLDKICDYFNCQPSDIIEHIPNEIAQKPMKRDIQSDSLSEYNHSDVTYKTKNISLSSSPQSNIECSTFDLQENQTHNLEKIVSQDKDKQKLEEKSLKTKHTQISKH